MFSRHQYVPVPVARGWRPGCPGCLLVVIGAVFVGWVILSSGMVALPFLSMIRFPQIPLPSLNSLVQAAQRPQESSAVTGQPTLSASFINLVLDRAYSPAAGTGQALYDLSVKYGVDDVYALAFFKHESEYGETGVARVTLSLGNIRCSLGYRCIDGYRAYATWQAGYADWYALIKCGYVGGCARTDLVSRRCPCVTVEQIIPVYAPAADHNDEAAYIAAVLSAKAAWQRGQVVV